MTTVNRSFTGTNQVPNPKEVFVLPVEPEYYFVLPGGLVKLTRRRAHDKPS